MPAVRVKRLRIIVVVAIPLLIVCLFWLASNPREILDKGQEAGSRFPDVSFTDVTGKAGIHFQHVNGATGRKLLSETMGSGVVVLDFNGDGRPDLFFVNSCPWPGFTQSPNTTMPRAGDSETLIRIDAYGFGTFSRWRRLRTTRL